MPRPITVVEEMYVPRKYFQTIGGFSAPDFSAFCTKHGIGKNEEELYPVFAICGALNADRKKHRGASVSSDLEEDLKKEKLLEARIKNQEKLKLLIPIDDAKARVRSAFLGVANILKYAIKSSAPRVALNNNVRECENILVNCYNEAIEHIKNTAKIQDWEEMGADTELRGVELSKDSGAYISSGSRKENTIPDQG